MQPALPNLLRDADTLAAARRPSSGRCKHLGWRMACRTCSCCRQRKRGPWSRTCTARGPSCPPQPASWTATGRLDGQLQCLLAAAAAARARPPVHRSLRTWHTHPSLFHAPRQAAAAPARVVARPQQCLSRAHTTPWQARSRLQVHGGAAGRCRGWRRPAGHPHPCDGCGCGGRQRPRRRQAPVRGAHPGRGDGRAGGA
jgi:hypothetical protein